MAQIRQHMRSPYPIIIEEIDGDGRDAAGIATTDVLQIRDKNNVRLMGFNKSGNLGLGSFGGASPDPTAFKATLVIVPSAFDYKGLQIRARSDQVASLLRLQAFDGVTNLFDVTPDQGTSIRYIKTNFNGPFNGLYINLTETGVNSGTTTGVALDITSSEDSPNEPCGYFAKLTGLGTGRLWMMDTKLYGPTATQAGLMLGQSTLMVNRNSGSVFGGGSVGHHIVTERKNEGEIVDATWPIDIGLLINGRSGDVSDTNQGFGIGIQIGGTGKGGWQPGASRIGTGFYARDYETTGLLIDNAFANAAIGIQIKASATQTGSLLETYTTSGALSVVLPSAGGITSRGRITVADSGGNARMSLDNTSGLMFRVSAFEQTTVGAAGGASALPATPTKYLKITDSAGATLVIPAYAAV